MEIRHYLTIARRWWWLLALPVVLLTVMTVLTTSGQRPEYESRSTFVVRTRLTPGQEIGKATDTLLRAAEVTPTFAEIATSNVIGGRARAQLVDEGLTSPGDSNVASTVVAGTTVLSITVTSPDPAYAQALLEKVATETVGYVEALNYQFTLAPLDEPTLPSTPVPSRRGLTIAISAILGLLLGALATFLAEYLRAPATRNRQLQALDPVTGLHTEEYYERRFQQELSRVERTGESFTVAALTVTSTDAHDGRPVPSRTRDVVMAAELLTLALRPEDVIAHVGDGTIMALLPATDEAHAEHLVAKWRRLLWPSTDGVAPPLTPFTIAAGLCEYGGRGTNGRTNGSRNGNDDGETSARGRLVSPTR